MHSGPSGAPRQRQILPATATVRPPVEVAAKPKHKLRASAVIAACESCRRKKLKCSGERPSCRRCLQRHQHCLYTTKPGETEAQARDRVHRELKQKVSASDQILELLTTLPEQDAQVVLKRIRAGNNLSSIVRQVTEGDLLLQMSVQPETRFRYEFPYRTGMPEDLLENNPYLNSTVYEALSLFPSGSLGGHSPKSYGESVIEPGHKTYQDLYLRPFHAAEVIDVRLSDAKFSAWTSVCKDDVLMRDIVRWWLRCEYQFTAAFQKDLFFEDMAGGRQDFCSPLLVNIMLGYACVCYPRFTSRERYWEPDTLMYRFIAEARRLWELEAHKPRITTIQAGMLFNVYYNLCGLDELGQAYRLHAIDLAREMHLLDASVKSRNARLDHGRGFAAWALFNWESLVGFSFNFVPLLSTPPTWILPDLSETPEWYGEIWVRYPLSQSRVPSYFGHIFKARSRFRVLMNEACQVAFSDGPEMTLEQGLVLGERLDAWYNELPSPLQPNTIVLPVHLQLHTYYYHLLLTIFEPLLENYPAARTPLQQIVAEARKHLHTLVRLYYLRHGFEAMDLFIVIPLMLVASELLDAMDESLPLSKLENLRSTLILVAKGLHSQRRNHYLADALFRVIRGRMRISEISLFKGVLNMDEAALNDRPDMIQAVRSQWPVSIVKRKEETNSHILTNLIENYGHLDGNGGPSHEPSGLDR